VEVKKYPTRILGQKSCVKIEKKIVELVKIAISRQMKKIIKTQTGRHGC
jgi:phage-related holin